MKDLLKELEKERRKLNELGNILLEHSIPLSGSQEIQEQSKKVDELMIRYHQIKAKCKQ